MISLGNKFFLVHFTTDSHWGLRHLCIPGEFKDGCYVSRKELWECIMCKERADKKIQVIYGLWKMNHFCSVD